MSKEKPLTYQAAVQELETILQQVENNEVDIDILSEKVKRASWLLNFCTERLRATEEEIAQLQDAD
jgi:exodeoxyribonuclease VII small subunit